MKKSIEEDECFFHTGLFQENIIEPVSEENKLSPSYCYYSDNYPYDSTDNLPY